MSLEHWQPEKGKIFFGTDRSGWNEVVNHRKSEKMSIWQRVRGAWHILIYGEP